MVLKKEKYTLEYGQTISTDVSTYLNNTDEFMKDTKIEGMPSYEDKKDYPSVGEYEFTLVHDNEKKKVKVSVKDTTPPFILTNEMIEVENGKKVDVENIKTEDLSLVNVVIDDLKIDYNKAGLYTIKVQATDQYGNQASKELEVKVKEKKKRENNIIKCQRI